MTTDLLATLALAALFVGVVSVGAQVPLGWGLGLLALGVLGFARWGR